MHVGANAKTRKRLASAAENPSPLAAATGATTVIAGWFGFGSQPKSQAPVVIERSGKGLYRTIRRLKHAASSQVSATPSEGIPSSLRRRTSCSRIDMGDKPGLELETCGQLLKEPLLGRIIGVHRKPRRRVDLGGDGGGGDACN